MATEKKTPTKRNSAKTRKSRKKNTTAKQKQKSIVGLIITLFILIVIFGSIIVYATLIFPQKLSSMITKDVVDIYQTRLYDKDNPKMIIFRLQNKPTQDKQEEFVNIVKQKYDLDVTFKKIATATDKGINQITFAKNGNEYHGIKDIYIYWDNKISDGEEHSAKTMTTATVENAPRQPQHFARTTTTTNKPMKATDKIAKDSGLKEKNEIKTFQERQKSIKGGTITKKTVAPNAKPAPVEKETPNVSIEGRITIIIDDVGYAYEATDNFLSIGVPLTFAIIPETPNATRYYNIITRNKYESIIHLPMEPEKGATFVEPNALLTTMSEIEITTSLQRFFLEMPECIGANNHMGSKAVTDGALMNALIGYLAKERKIWVDSMTNANTLSPELAEIYHIPELHRDVFLDNQKDITSLKHSMEILIDEAKKNGYAIGIGHAQTKLLPEVIKQYYDERKMLGIEFVSLREQCGNKK